MNLTKIVALAAALMLPAVWANAAEPAPAPAGEKTEKTTKSKKEGSSDSAKTGEGEKKAEKK